MKHYYFIGIGGIGMSGLAKILLDRGDKVSGSDIAQNKQTTELQNAGAKIYHDHEANNIENNIDCVVITSAIKQDNPELVKAKELGLNVIFRSQLLNEIISKQKSIAVTGTHGKTTTSSMVASILEIAGMDPTAIIGAEVQTISGNSKHGEGEYSVAEVCEYQRAFLDIYPYSAIITNIEADHLDCYIDLNDIINAFSEFVTHINKDGYLVVHGEDESIKKVSPSFKGKVITYGFAPENDFYAVNTKTIGHKTTFTVMNHEKEIGSFELIIPGKHNILNSLAAIALTVTLDVPAEDIKKALSGFNGASRRFQIMGEKDGVLYIDDYAHHPTEIAATLSGAKQFYPDKRIIAVFQPHQHSRTKLLIEDFSKAFKHADIVLVPEIYAVRDSAEDIKAVSSSDLVAKINQVENCEKATYFKDFEEVKSHLATICRENDLVLTIGAGPVNTVANDILSTESNAIN